MKNFTIPRKESPRVKIDNEEMRKGSDWGVNGIGFERNKSSKDINVGQL